jgi:hypothetical protein
MRKLIIIIVLIFISVAAKSATYYVAIPANGGNDANAGTIGSPFATWGRLSTALVAGDIAYIRGGTYRSTSGSGDKVLWDNLHGTSTDTIKIFAYPGETPILNLDNITTGTSHSAMVRINNCDYLHIKGLRVTGGIQDESGNVLWGMLFVDVNNSKIENCIVDHIEGYGFAFGAAEYGSGGSNNLILNCDAYANEDPHSETPYGGSNGFTVSRFDNTSTNITFRYCRAWNNSDDGFDLYGLNGVVSLENCWSFRNGYREGTETLAGDGMGFKLGPTSADFSTTHLRTVTNCVSVHNRNFGFDENTDTYTSVMWLYNNLSYNNRDHGFFFGYGINAVDVFRNNIEYNSLYGNTFDATDNGSNNSWDASPAVTVSGADFASLDETQLFTGRLPNGDLPVVPFGRLVLGSDLIDKGANVGLPYGGLAPDLGAFEYDALTVTTPTVITNPASLVTTSSALSGGIVISDGGATVTDRGICWSTTNNPTTAQFTTHSGTGAGSYNSSLTSLSAATTYYVRAFATNSVGTSYGANIPVTTSSITIYESTGKVVKITGKVLKYNGKTIKQ